MKKIFISILFILMVSSNLTAQIRLPKLISDGMILQRDVPIKIWGWASANEKISLTLNKKKFKTIANKDGNWFIMLPKQKANLQPTAILLKGKNEITLSNILFGDVWFCSGQSNMVHQLNIHDVTYAKEIAEANNNYIRQFLIPTVTNLVAPQSEFAVTNQPALTWKAAVGDDIRPFSAVAYFFAKNIYQKYHIPIGIINSSVGGTPIEAWTSEDGLKDFSAIFANIQKNKDTALVNKINREAAFANTPAPIKDAGMMAEKKWYDINYEPKGWKNINMPGYWEDQGIKDLNGIVWYRKEINIAKNMIGKAAKVFLGRIVDADELYINGKKIGNTSYQYPQRRYAVAADILKQGKNIFVVRVTNNSGKGGFIPDKPYCIFADNDTVDLKGTWQYKVGDVFLPRNNNATSINLGSQPTALYNAMVAPAINYSIKGFCWYQGEANTSRPEEYAALQPALIKDWRNKWNLGDLPFLYAQLPGFMDYNYLPSESNWAAFRASQLKTLSVPNTAMAVTIDLGEWNDIHPDNKKTVGDRLALAAFKNVYAENIVCSGPIYQSSLIDGNKMVLSFTNSGSSLTTSDGEAPAEFAIAGTDKKFIWAKTKIEGNKIIVWNDEIKNPFYVRYGWTDNPVNPNLINKEGLPASPFEAEILNQTGGVWKNKKCAVVITYDDAMDVHLDNALPILDSLNLKATFYLTAFANASKNRLNEWKTAAAKGYELGNHTLFHPCLGNIVGRDWVKGEQDMSKYNVQRLENEIRMTNVFLETLDGKKKRTFAYTCGDMKVADSNFIDGIKNDFVAARAVRSEMHTIDKIDLYNTDCYAVNGETAEQMIEWVKKAEQTESLLVMLFHGVGGGHSLNVSLDAHKKLLQYLKHNDNKIWVAPMLEVADYINSWQKKNKK